MSKYIYHIFLDPTHVGGTWYLGLDKDRYSSLYDKHEILHKYMAPSVTKISSKNAILQQEMKIYAFCTICAYVLLTEHSSMNCRNKINIYIENIPLNNSRLINLFFKVMAKTIYCKQLFHQYAPNSYVKIYFMQFPNALLFNQSFCLNKTRLSISHDIVLPCLQCRHSHK